MKYLFLPLFFSLFFLSCQPDDPEAKLLIDKAIEKAGGDLYTSSRVEFDFRGKQYITIRNQGNFTYTRVNQKGDSLIIDSFGNEMEFQRSINLEVVEVPDSMKTRFENSINSVNYFLFLPYGLNDDAVNKKILGEEEINDKDYYKIQVTFDEEGGGADFEDVYIYWLNKMNHTIDFFAYEFHVNGGGMRFREAFNPRRKGGIRFVDYYNYKPKTKVKLEELGQLFNDEELELLSIIRKEKIKVTPLIKVE